MKFELAYNPYRELNELPEYIFLVALLLIVSLSWLFKVLFSISLAGLQHANDWGLVCESFSTKEAF